MSDTKFKIGNVVKLKSNPQHMTISDLEDSDGYVECTWIAANGIKQIEEFDINILELVHN
ncbi:MAG: DUF2158 domain-containing protein [Prevotella sp.]|jgi:uncharacterized protein YodC (DUF2158 family)|nr:DUF2158 domain-containing protein [Prevotella sp.]